MRFAVHRSTCVKLFVVKSDLPNVSELRDIVIYVTVTLVIIVYARVVDILALLTPFVI